MEEVRCIGNHKLLEVAGGPHQRRAELRCHMCRHLVWTYHFERTIPRNSIRVTHEFNLQDLASGRTAPEAGRVEVRDEQGRWTPADPEILDKVLAERPDHAG